MKDKVFEYKNLLQSTRHQIFLIVFFTGVFFFAQSRLTGTEFVDLVTFITFIAIGGEGATKFAAAFRAREKGSDTET